VVPPLGVTTGVELAPELPWPAPALLPVDPVAPVVPVAPEDPVEPVTVVAAVAPSTPEGPLEAPPSALR
jgi:hypothetical protein